MLGLVAAFVGAQIFGGESVDDTASGARTVPGEVDSPQDLLPDDLPVPPGAGAESAEAAVTGFLDAEVAGDYEESFGYLQDVHRADYLSPAGWVSAHADVLPTILDYELGEQTELDDGRTTIRTVVQLEPGLDQVVGLTPAEAVVHWDVVRGEDGWGVSLDTSPFEPVYPDEDGAVPAARTWAEARQRCDTPANERGGLIGSPALAEALCDTDGGITVGEPEPLDELAAQPFSTAYGAEAVAAARTVRVTGPAELGVVLVPIGDDWTVIGVIP